MRIEISARETGSLQTGLSDLHSDINATIESLRRTRNQFYNMNGGVSNLADAVSSLDHRIQQEERKLDAVQELSRKTTAFLSSTVATDTQVARMVAANQNQFFQQYKWLKPVVPEEKSWWERRLDDWNRLWEGAGQAFRNLAENASNFLSKTVDFVKETVKDVFETVVTFVQEHWVELVVGAAAIIAGAALLVVTGGMAGFGAALLAGLKAAAVSAAIDGAISAAIALVTGDDVGRALGDGLASGFMMGGIFFAIGSGISALRSSLQARNVSQNTRAVANQGQGKRYEIVEGKKFKKKYPKSDTQITIETMVNGKPVKFRIDQMGYDKNGNLILQELKSSPTATLTRNQKLAWGKNLTNKGRYGVLENGGIVKGRANKALFPKGFQIPPGTKVQVVRPPIPFKDIEALNKISKFTIFNGGLLGLTSHTGEDVGNMRIQSREPAGNTMTRERTAVRQ